MLGRDSSMQRGRWLVVVFLLLGLLPFDEEIIGFSTGIGDQEGPRGSVLIGLAVVVCDMVLLVAAWRLTAGSLTKMWEREQRRRWLLALVAAVMADAVFYLAFDARHGHFERRIILAVVLFIPPLLLAIAAAQRLDAPALARGLRGPRRKEWAKLAQLYLLPALPLVVGVGVSFVAGSLWDDLRCSNPECSPVNEVNGEFFAQMAQVLPLLLIALLLESEFLKPQKAEPASRRAIAVYTVLVLVVAEALVFSALASPDLSKHLPDAHSYAAFAGAWYATGVAATCLVIIAATTRLSDSEAS